MRDAMEARMWAEHGSKFSDAVFGVFRDVGVALRRLNEIEFDAPWRHSERSNSAKH